MEYLEGESLRWAAKRRFSSVVQSLWLSRQGHGLRAQITWVQKKPTTGTPSRFFTGTTIETMSGLTVAFYGLCRRNSGAPWLEYKHGISICGSPLICNGAKPGKKRKASNFTAERFK